MVSHVKWSFVWVDEIGRWRRESIFCKRSRYLWISTLGNVCVKIVECMNVTSSRAHCAKSFRLSSISLSGPARRNCIFILNRIILFRVGKWAMRFFWIAIGFIIYMHCASGWFLLSIMMHWIEFVRQMPFAHVAKFVSIINFNKTNESTWMFGRQTKARRRNAHYFIQRSRLTSLSSLFFFRRKLSHAYLAIEKKLLS